MGKKTLADRLQVSLATKGQTLTKRDSQDVLDAFFDVLYQSILEDGRVRCQGIGTFTVKVTKERTARNPKTGEKIEVPARQVLRFKPAISLAKELNEK